MLKSGVPVIELDDFEKSLSVQEKANIEILIATPENVMPEIEQALDAKGFFCHVRLTASRWSTLLAYSFAIDGQYKPLSALPIGYHKADIHVFMAKHYKDKKLEKPYCFPKLIEPVQAGADLCTEKIAEILDCDGENISEKNVNYSELTVLYWVWKNRLNRLAEDGVSEYYGLMHYRRLLELTKDDILRLVDNDIDVVLPFPMSYEPDINAHHKRYLNDKDWNTVINVVQKLHPEYADVFPQIFSKRYFYNYNIVLAKKDVLAEYCEWLFPILEETEKMSVPRGCDRQDRYIGYIGESLSTLYFMANADKLKIAHAGCRFLV